MTQSRERRRGSLERRGRSARGGRVRPGLPRPSPLPPHPEGLKPSVWPPLLALVAFGILLLGVGQGRSFTITVGLVAVGLVILYAVLTRDDRRRTLLYAYIVGRRQFDTGQYEAALANFADMEEADFAPPAVLRGLGLSNYHLGRWAEAATYLEDVPDRTPEEDAVLAHALVETGETDEALRVLSGLEDPPPLARLVRGIVLLQQGLAAEAAERLEDILEEAGGPAAPAEEPYLGARYWLGLALRRAGEEGRAKEVLEELYEIDPSYHDVAALLGRRALEDQDDAT